MPIFSSFEKDIVKCISEMDISNPHIFGEWVSPVMFKSKECALYLATNANNHVSQNETARLYGRNGANSHELRGNMLTVLSLIRYLEDNRYVYLQPGPSAVSEFLFNEDSLSPQPLSVESITTDSEGNVISANRFDPSFIDKYRVKLGNGGVFIVKTEKDSGLCKSYIEYDGDTMLNELHLSDTLSPQIERIFSSQIFPTVRLKNLVDRDFKSEEEIATEKAHDNAQAQLREAKLQSRCSFGALIAAISTIVISIVLPKCDKTANETLQHVQSIDAKITEPKPMREAMPTYVQTPQKIASKDTILTP